MTAIRGLFGVLISTALACSAGSTGGGDEHSSAHGGSAATAGGVKASGGNSAGGNSAGGDAAGGNTAGGNAAGGNAAGGTSAGGTSAGGNAAGGGNAGGGTASNFANTPECSMSSQCSLANDCCSCHGLAPGETAPACGSQLCKATTCQVLGLGVSPAAQCQVGRCVAGFDCDLSKVLCKSVPPTCPAGETPSVEGICYGPCVPAVECATVANCDQCDASAHVCVSEMMQVGPSRHCVEKPSACGSSPDCACMGASVCLTPYYQCSDAASGGINCYCPNC